MDKELIQKLKQKLEQEKEIIEKELKRFAKKDEKLKGDWDTRFPKFDGGEVGGAALEKAADEVEEYEALLPLEHNLETKLQDINLALEKIEKNKYGKCEKCQKEISEKRLEVYPEARFCLKCKK